MPPKKREAPVYIPKQINAKVEEESFQPLAEKEMESKEITFQSLPLGRVKKVDDDAMFRCYLGHINFFQDAAKQVRCVYCVHTVANKLVFKFSDICVCGHQFSAHGKHCLNCGKREKFREGEVYDWKCKGFMPVS